jgi:hypothetical protein
MEVERENDHSGTLAVDWLALRVERGILSEREDEEAGRI